MAGAGTTTQVGGYGGSGGSAGGLLAANNLSDVLSAATSRTNLGFSALTDYVTLTGTQTLTNKTLTSPTVTSLTGTGTTTITGTTAINPTGVSSFTVGSSAGSAPIDFISRQSPTSSVYTTSTNAVIEDFALYTKSSSGTPAAGYGGKLNFYADTNGSTNRNSGYLGIAWSTATDASRTAYAEFRLANNASLIQTVDIVPGGLNIYGTTSGVISIRAAAAAGTWTFTLPTTDGNANEFLQTNGSGVSTWAVVTDALLSTSDITTNDVSTTKHGFAPKAPNDATKFLNGVGAWAVPSGGGGGGGATVVAATGVDAASGISTITACQQALGSTVIAFLSGNTNILVYDGSAWSTVAHGVASACGIYGNSSTGVLCVCSNTSATVARIGTDGGSFSNSSGTIAQVGGGVCCNPTTSVWVMYDGTTASSAATRSTNDATSFSSAGMSGFTHAAGIRGMCNDEAGGGSAIWIAALNSTATLKSTDDGLTWAAGGVAPFTSSCISFGGGYFVLSSNTVQFAYSTNGTSWTTKPTPTSSTGKLKYANGYWWFFQTSGISAVYRTSDITQAQIQWECILTANNYACAVSERITYYDSSYWFMGVPNANSQPVYKLTI